MKYCLFIYSSYLLIFFQKICRGQTRHCISDNYTLQLLPPPNHQHLTTIYISAHLSQDGISPTPDNQLTLLRPFNTFHQFLCSLKQVLVGPGKKQLRMSMVWVCHKQRTSYTDIYVFLKKYYQHSNIVHIFFVVLNRVKEGLFQYAGTKDRRAKTSQEITAYKCVNLLV